MCVGLETSRPFILFFWGLYDLGLLAGSSAFVRHWLYWQNIISMFNENNHSGTVLDNPKNYLAIWLAVGIGSVVSLKRLLVGLFLGRQTFGKDCLQKKTHEFPTDSDRA